MKVSISGSDGSKLDLEDIDFAWAAGVVATRTGDFREGQKGAIVEMFGWPHADVEKECAFLAKVQCVWCVCVCKYIGILPYDLAFCLFCSLSGGVPWRKVVPCARASARTAALPGRHEPLGTHPIPDFVHAP